MRREKTAAEYRESEKFSPPMPVLIALIDELKEDEESGKFSPRVPVLSGVARKFSRGDETSPEEGQEFQNQKISVQKKCFTLDAT